VNGVPAEGEESGLKRRRKTSGNGRRLERDFWGDEKEEGRADLGRQVQR
jgi:hypothetical protein